MSTNGFKELGLSPATLRALEEKGFEEPTIIQEKVIPLLLNGEKDIIGQAQTGTGKTAAFGLPIIERISPGKKIKVLILTPTRELAVQVAEEINSLKGNKKLRLLPVYGGQPIDRQIRKLRNGIEIVVGTPGRIIDHIKRKTVDFSNIEYLILDEADEMLNMGFIEEVEVILQSVNKNRKMLLFSATMPAKIQEIARKYMKDFDRIVVKKEQLVTNLTDQIYFEVSESDKFEALSRIIDMEEVFYGLIFCRTKVNVDKLAGRLLDRGYDSDGLHGDISQAQREKILDKFRKKQTMILAATDVAARGIDISNLTHVINYSLPQNPESYVHRIGRTGRAGNEGTAITFITPSEYRKLNFIKRIVKTEIRKEKLPGIADIIRSKRERIKSDIEDILESKYSDNYREIAESLLLNHDPAEVTGAVLYYALKNELDESSYREIRDISVDKKGKTRLFIAKGKKDNMSKTRLINMIGEKANVRSKNIYNIEIFNDYSFISVSFNDAEKILRVFRKNKRGKRSLIVPAQKRKR